MYLQIRTAKFELDKSLMALRKKALLHVYANFLYLSVATPLFAAYHSKMKL